MKPDLYVIDGGRTERRREQEANPLAVFVLLLMGFYCLLIGIFAPWPL